MLKQRILIAKIQPTNPSLLFYSIDEAFEYFKEQGFVDETADYVVLYHNSQWELHELK